MDEQQQQTNLEETLAARVGRFAREFDNIDANNENDSSEDLEGNATVGEAEEEVQLASSEVKNHTALMTAFRKIVAVDSAEDLLDEVYVGAMIIEGAESVVGAVSDARKVKSLVQRWLAKPASNVRAQVDDVETRGKKIERDTILVVKVKLGSGAAAATVSRFVRVVNIFEKYYNKWFMSKEPFKVWKKEQKKYKLEVRMSDKNALNEYVDVALVGDPTYSKDEICLIVEDDQIVRVVGRMQEAA